VPDRHRTAAQTGASAPPAGYQPRFVARGGRSRRIALEPALGSGSVVDPASSLPYDAELSMAAKLILLGGDHPVEHILSSFNTLGRHPDNSIQVLDRIVSKEHSRITLGPDGRYVVRDVGSLNGTFVNGEKVSERVLKSGDQISLGNTTYRFTEDRPQDKLPIRKVTMTPDQVQSQVQSTLAASSTFLPEKDIKDITVLRADYEKLRVAHELSQKLSIDADLDTLLQKIVDEAFLLIRADRAVILLLDAETDDFVPRYVRQKRDEEIKLSKSILDEVRTKKRAVLSSDAMVDERFKAAKSIIMQGIRSTMCVPLLYGDRAARRDAPRLAVHVERLHREGPAGLHRHGVAGRRSPSRTRAWPAGSRRRRRPAPRSRG
jgi:pSer/pThr/pTyr-binding forkhead associated (FHA) protein